MTEKSTLENTILCTYFDKGYLLRGLALHASLIKHAPRAKLWIFSFDKYSERILNKMNLKGVTVVSLGEFEDSKLLAVKRSRSNIEYMWTVTPSIPLFIFRKSKKTKYVAYLDSDGYFFSSPESILRELGNKSLLAVEHRYPKGREGLNETDGRFNVAVNVFKKDKTGIKCLKRWRNQCLKWCYWRLENGKMGDQLYLNEWPKLYGKNLVISKNLGVNVAPWNVSQYRVTERNKNVMINSSKLVYYHFHQFQIFGPDEFDWVYGYTLSKEVIELIYKPYEKELKNQYKRVIELAPSYKIEPPMRYSAQIIRQKMGKYLGPIYWRLLTLAFNVKSVLLNDKNEIN